MYLHLIYYNLYQISVVSAGFCAFETKALKSTSVSKINMKQYSDFDKFSRIRVFISGHRHLFNTSSKVWSRNEMEKNLILAMVGLE